MISDLCRYYCDCFGCHKLRPRKTLKSAVGMTTGAGYHLNADDKVAGGRGRTDPSCGRRSTGGKMPSTGSAHYREIVSERSRL